MLILLDNWYIRGLNAAASVTYGFTCNEFTDTSSRPIKFYSLESLK